MSSILSAKAFQDEVAAYAWIEERVWPDGPTCPHCGAVDRIKRLRGMSQPQYRLRVGEIRVFYDVIEESIEILAIVKKSGALAWLEKKGKPDEGSSTV